MNKKLIRLTESDLHNIVKETVYRIIMENDYDFEYQAYRNRNDNESTYLQVSMMGSPEIYKICNGHNASNEYIKTYNLLCKYPAEKVLPLWRKCAYKSNVTSNYNSNDKFIVEQDDDGIYLPIRIDNEEDIQKYQNGNW